MGAELPFEVEGDFGDWAPPSIRRVDAAEEAGVEIWEVALTRETAAAPPLFSLRFGFPNDAVAGLWTPSGDTPVRSLPPEWKGKLDTRVNRNAPMLCFFGDGGENRAAFAVADARRRLDITAGYCEDDGRLRCRVVFFAPPDIVAPLARYATRLRIDRRRRPFGETVRDMADWYAGIYPPAPVPDAAREPVYSTWYSHHQRIDAATVEAECAEAAAYGLSGVIVDDGWQTDVAGGGYAHCGDWTPNPRAFSDMAAHVRRVQAMGMRYLLWYAPPFVGERSAALGRFAGQCLHHRPELGAYVLDPRFAAVRAHLADGCEAAMREWKLDGLKIDFIDCFEAREGDVSAASDATSDAAADGSGRDTPSVAEAVEKLLAEISARLRAVKPDALVEFRQPYTGPAMRSHANLFRAGDCAGDALGNRLRTIDLRLALGKTPVHSDMVMWSAEESAPSAARQLWNVLFSVPQISMRLGGLPPAHREMLRFFLGFWRSRRATLLEGAFRPVAPELNYPAVYAARGKETVAAVYDAAHVVEWSGGTGDSIWIVNATSSPALWLCGPCAPKAIRAFDAQGREVPTAYAGGMARAAIPASGILAMEG